eukprot:gene22981-27796_t
MSEGGIPSYDIVQPSAWDAISMTPELSAAAEQASALVFGSLSQRCDTTRDTVRCLLQLCDRCVFDVNFRPPYYDQPIVEEGLTAAWLAK